MTRKPGAKLRGRVFSFSDYDDSDTDVEVKMNPIITYETVRETDGNMKIYAVMNKPFIEGLTFPDTERLFQQKDGRFVLISEDSANFALVVDADSNESGITEAIDILNDRGTEVEIRTEAIENRLGFGTDINPTARSLSEALQHVKSWLDAGTFAPEPEPGFEFPA